MNSFYTREELKNIGFLHIGENVFISRKASIYGEKNISIGDNVRIDDFCILSGNIKIGNFVHIGAYSALYGKYGIELQDYCIVSARVLIYSAIDDFSGNSLPFSALPLIPQKFVNITKGTVVLKRFVLIGCNTVIFPECILDEGVAVGAMSLIKNSFPAWKIICGIPAKILKDRKQNILEIEKNFLLNGKNIL